MSIQIDMLPAAHGDAILTEWRTDDGHVRFLIDGGPKKSYVALKQRLADVDDLDLLTISHVDTDHIDGVVTLLLDEDLSIRIGDIWFNGRNHIYEPLSRAAGNSYLGGVQGEVLSAILSIPGLSWNSGFDGRAVVIPENRSDLPQKDIGGLKFTLLSPRVKQLERLKRDWNRHVASALKSLELLPDGSSAEDIAEAIQSGGYDTARALLRSRYSRRLRPPTDWETEIPEAAQPGVLGDSSRANGSSIAFLVKDSASGTTVLYGADAHADVLTKSIAQLLRNRTESRLRVDAFKVPHHGSKNNISRSLLDKLDCTRFLFSTDGSHGHDHPDDEAVLMILEHCADRGVVPTLYFNYLSDRTKHWRTAGGSGSEFHAVYPQQGRGEHGIVVELDPDDGQRP